MTFRALLWVMFKDGIHACLKDSEVKSSCYHMLPFLFIHYNYLFVCLFSFPNDNSSMRNVFYTVSTETVKNIELYQESWELQFGRHIFGQNWKGILGRERISDL